MLVKYKKPICNQYMFSVAAYKILNLKFYMVKSDEIVQLLYDFI